MDASAIKEIRKNVSVEDMQIALDSLGLAVPHIVHAKNVEITSVEYAMPTRAFMRGDMLTDNVGSFFDYTKQHGNADSSCFIFSEDMRASVIFDMGSKAKPLHCRHMATLALRKTADFLALGSMVRAAGDVSQRELSEWIEDYADIITLTDAHGDKIETEVGISVLRDLDFSSREVSHHHDHALRSSRSSFKEIQVSSRLPIPVFISFCCVPYADFESRTFTARLDVLTGYEKPTFSARIVRIDRHKAEMAEEFERLVSKGVSEHGVITYIGSFSA
ncbi:MAG: DUF2303 family protein [Ghiorsea sp.]